MSAVAGPSDPSDDAGLLDDVARAAFEACAGTPGAVVGVRRPEGTWTRAYGLADPERGSAMTVGTHLRIGSVTKTFVGTLLLQLVAAGEVTLDDPISRFVPGVPEGERVTLDLLATMRSGVADYLANPAFVAQVVGDPTASFTAAALVEAGCALPPAFAPDAQFAYANTNYVLLGSVIERVAGAEIGTLLGARIVEPLGLTGTSWPGDDPAIPAPYAQGFTRSVPSVPPGEAVVTTGWNPSWAGAAGAMISTVDDLLAFGHALVAGPGVLDEEARSRRLASLRPAPALGDGVDYGLGLMRIGRWIGHSGDIPGYRAAMYHEPASATTLVVLTNSDIVAGRCPEAVAPTAVATDAECMAPTARIFDAVATALGIPTVSPHPS